MMKRTAILFVLAILVLMPFTAMASAPQVSCKEGTCNNLKITKLTLNYSALKDGDSNFNLIVF